MTVQNESPQELLKKADQLRLSGQYDQALTLLEEIIRDHPFYAPAKLSLGRVFFENGNLESARIALEEFSEFVPDHPLANKILGKIYFHFSKHTKALEKIQAVLNDSPNDTVAKKLFDQIQEQSGERKSDDEETKKNKVTNRTATIAEIYRSQGHLKEALEIYKELQEKNAQPDYEIKIKQIESQLDDPPVARKIQDEASTMETMEYHPEPFSPSVETESFGEDQPQKQKSFEPEEPYAEIAVAQEEPTVDEPAELIADHQESFIPQDSGANFAAETNEILPPTIQLDTKPTKKQKLERLLQLVQQYRGH